MAAVQTGISLPPLGMTPQGRIALLLTTREGTVGWLVERGQKARDDRRMPASSMAESQTAALQNMRVLVEEAQGLARDLAYHRRAVLEEKLGHTLDEINWQIEDLRRSSLR